MSSKRASNQINEVKCDAISTNQDDRTAAKTDRSDKTKLREQLDRKVAFENETLRLQLKNCQGLVVVP